MNIVKKTIYGLIKKLKFLPPEFYVKIYYEYYTGKKINLRNPVGFNEKIQWLKVYYKPDILTKLVDKFEVRSYIKEKIGEQYLNDLLGVYTSYDEIDFDALPDKFVLKGVHGCNYNLIVKDKSRLNKKKVNQLINKWLSRNYYYRSGLEWAYKNIPPRIIAEKFMQEEGKEVLNDYKLFCFNGSPKFIQVDIERKINDSRCYYDTQWQKLPVNRGKPKLHLSEVEKPKNLSEMLELAKILSNPFPFVRVDFYSINGQTIFGEMTFYPADGRYLFKPIKYNRIFGDYMKLPAIPEGKKYIDSI
jgi:hypothetical protein